LLCKGIAVNTSYNSTLGPSMDCNASILVTGNRTECALLGLVHRLGVDFQEIRDTNPECGFAHVYPFTPDTKMMSTIIPTSWGGFRMYTKGSPETVLARTSFILMADGEEKPLDDTLRCRFQTRASEPENEKVRTFD
jgi:Ca2+ transporting ATPase